MNRLVLTIGVWVMTTSPAFGWHDAAEEFVATLNSPEAQQEFGVQEVRRPPRVVNRLDVVFREDLQAPARSQALQTIGWEFLMILFDRRGIPTVTIVERDASGTVLDRAVVRIFGGTIARLPSC